TLSKVIWTTCLTPLPRWHADVLSLVSLTAPACLAAPPAASEVPARPSVPSMAAELAAAVMRYQAARLLRRRLPMSLSPSDVIREPPSRRRASPRCHAFSRLIRGLEVSICSNLVKHRTHPCLKLLGEGRDLAGQGEVVRGQAAGRVRAEGQRHLVPLDR